MGESTGDWEVEVQVYRDEEIRKGEDERLHPLLSLEVKVARR
jgi:hypothetical protein